MHPILRAHSIRFGLTKRLSSSSLTAFSSSNEENVVYNARHHHERRRVSRDRIGDDCGAGWRLVRVSASLGDSARNNLPPFLGGDVGQIVRRKQTHHSRSYPRVIRISVLLHRA